jgi:hypothetical protein
MEHWRPAGRITDFQSGNEIQQPTQYNQPGLRFPKIFPDTRIKVIGNGIQEYILSDQYRDSFVPVIY